MKKLVLFSFLLVSLYSCQKDKTRQTQSYGQGVEGLGLSYNKAYILFFDRQVGGVTRSDSDRVIFYPNGTVTEISNYFDSGSYVFRDSINYPVNTSFSSGIYYNNIADVSLFTIYPDFDTTRYARRFLLRDYLRASTVNLYRAKGNTAGLRYIQVTHSASDSVSVVTGRVEDNR